MRYFEEQEFVVEKLECLLDGRNFSGKGFLNWSPESGFVFKLLTQEFDRPQKIIMSTGRTRLIRKKDRRNITVSISGYEKVIIPSAYVPLNPLLLFENSFEFKASTLHFYKSFPVEHDRFWNGKAIFKLPKHPYALPQKVKKLETINDISIQDAVSQKGIYFQSDEGSITAYLVENEYLHIRYKLSKEFFNSEHSEVFPMGLELALSVLLGVQARLLMSDFYNENHQITKVNKEKDVITLNLFQRVFEPDMYTSEELFKLSNFLTSGLTDENNRNSIISCNILNQIIQSEKQENTFVSEFLISSIFEAILRTSLDIPYKEGRGGRSITNADVSSFKKQCQFNRDWKNLTDEAFSAYKAMRNRTAHPDWLFYEDYHSDHKLSDTVYDLFKLLSYYRQLILYFANMKNFNPEFPDKPE